MQGKFAVCLRNLENYAQVIRHQYIVRELGLDGIRLNVVCTSEQIVADLKRFQ